MLPLGILDLAGTSDGEASGGRDRVRRSSFGERPERSQHCRRPLSRDTAITCLRKARRRLTLWTAGRNGLRRHYRPALLSGATVCAPFKAGEPGISWRREKLLFIGRRAAAMMGVLDQSNGIISWLRKRGLSKYVISRQAVRAVSSHQTGLRRSSHRPLGHPLSPSSKGAAPRASHERRGRGAAGAALRRCRPRPGGASPRPRVRVPDVPRPAPASARCGSGGRYRRR